MRCDRREGSHGRRRPVFVFHCRQLRRTFVLATLKSVKILLRIHLLKMVGAGLGSVARSLPCRVVSAHHRQKPIAIAGKVAKHVQLVREAVDGNTISRIHLPQKFNQPLLSRCECMILKPTRRGLVRQRSRAVESIEIVEQNNRYASRLARAILHLIGIGVLRQRLCRLRRGFARVSRENTNSLRRASVDDLKIVLCQISNRPVCVANNHAKLNQVRR